MFKKAIVLASCLKMALLGFGAEMAPFGSVVGLWKFDASPYKGDSSGFGNDLTAFASGVTGVASGSASNGYDGSGHLNITTAKAMASGALVGCDVDLTKGHTIILRFKPNGVSFASAGDTETKKLLDTLKDDSKWHFAAYRYDPDQKANASYKTMMFTDPTYGDRYGNGHGGATDGSRAEVSIDDDGAVYFPVSVAGSTVTLGGEIGAKVMVDYYIYKDYVTKKADYKGTIDEAMIVSRVLTKQELTRTYHTGETCVYATGDVGFSSAANWSCCEGGLAYAPSALPGADYVVDNSRTVAADAATFGGRSLTLGRLAPLVSRVDGTTISTVNGNMSQSVTEVTVADLHLNNGKITGTAGRSLTATRLSISATEASPYEINVNSGTYVVTGTAVGGGWIRKTGVGTLDLTGLKGDFRVRKETGVVLLAVDYDYGAVPVLMAE